MSIKLVEKDSFEIVESAITKAVGLIKPTYGPSSNKVLISKTLTHGSYDDGVRIARELELADPAENAVWREAKEVAIKTNDRVGDGTTGALIMVESIVYEVGKISSTRRDGRKIEKELKKGLEEAKKQLLASAQPVKTKEDLLKVARISFDDEKIAEIIADTWHKLGKDGVVTVDRSGTMETFAEVTEGITINRGYVSPYMVTNPSRMEAVIEKPYILLTDYRLTEVNDILPIMNSLAEKNILSLVLVCDNIENNALATVIVNRVQGKFTLIAINVPFSDDKTQSLEDIGLMVGGKVFSEKKGDKLEQAVLADLGRADRFIAHRNESVIIGPRGKKPEIAKAIAQLKGAIENGSDEHEREKNKKRYARLTNKVAVVKVGAPTQGEENTLREKVDDAVNAVRAAYRGGVVCGAGLALARLETSSDILNDALKAPARQLRNNMGIGVDYLKTLKAGEAMNVVTGKIGKFMDVGVVDPVDVLIAGVESAVSIASLLITQSGMIIEPPKKPKEEE